MALGKRRVFLSLFGNMSQQVKIFSVDVFKIVIRNREGLVFLGCFCHDLHQCPLVIDIRKKVGKKGSLAVPCQVVYFFQSTC